MKDLSKEVREFRECDTCWEKPGMPILCNGCLHNRAVIENIRASTLQEAIEAVPGKGSASITRVPKNTWNDGFFDGWDGHYDETLTRLSALRKEV